MKIAVKQISVFLVCIVVALVITSVLGTRRELDRIESDVFVRQTMSGRILRAAFRTTREMEGPERAVDLVRFADSRISAIDIGWSDLDAVDEVSKDELRAHEEAHVIDEAHDRLSTYVLVPGRGTFADGALVLREGREPYRRQVAATMRAVAMSCAIAALVGGVIAAFFSLATVGRPLAALTEHARRVGAGDFASSVDLPSKDEIGVLAVEMNRMAARLQDSHVRLLEESRARLRALEELRHGDRLRTVGTLASGLAHELGTPLNIVLLRARMIASGRALAENAKDAGRVVVEQAERMTELVQRLLDFARRRPPRMAKVDVAVVSAKAASWLEGSAKKRDVAVKIDAPSTLLEVLADTVQLEQVLTNLLANAIDACQPGGHVRVRANLAEDGRIVRIDVEDDGVGIEDEVLPRILEPFFTTKEPGEGTGLGLSIADGIVRDHGGWIEVQSSAQQGSRFSVFLPGAPA